MKRMLFAGALCSVLLFGADEPMLNETPYAIAKQELGKGKAVMFEVGSDKCGSCQDMGRMLYRVKQSSPNAAIYFINVGQDRRTANTLGIQMIPTQIVYDPKGKEAYRHIGPLGTQELNSLLKKYAIK